MEQSYKEKYERALAKAKEQYNYPCMRSCLGILEEIFPELAESNDEKIRKVLIKFFSMGAKYNLHTDGIADKDIIAWLEKQGQVKESAISQHEIETCKENGNSLTYDDEAHVNSLLKRLEGLCRKEFATTRFAISEDKEWLKSLKERIGGKV